MPPLPFGNPLFPLRSRMMVAASRLALTTSAVLFSVMLGGAPVFAQEDAAPAGEVEAPAAKPKPKPKPRPKPVAKPAVKSGEPKDVAPALMPAANLAPVKLPELIVVCDNGQGAFYEGHGAVSLWVTRSGTITVDNPLRPLTPETTQVLQVVIGNKAATAFGPDLLALRRGGTPASLEAATGGPVRWDEQLTVLPDFLNVVSEAGEALARLDHRRCGDAPEVKQPPVAKAKEKEKEKAKPVAKSPRQPKPSAGEGAGREPGIGDGAVPRGLQLPQGAIPAGQP
ncbi:hypothetical protein [Methylobacterium marchantiae]|uniref:Uncharacterized protein n=1 Tax=Methylobacterium marchantiae TaxID=600331 RepID=A0ABW3WUS3_9HYPH